MTQVFLPRSLDELWDVLDRHPDSAVYAGGTDLLVNLRSGRFFYKSLVCLERIKELRGIRDDEGAIRIGAATVHAEILRSPLIESSAPVLKHAVRVLGSPPIRNMGTIGGNIVTASPAGDTLPPLYVLDAELEIRSRSHSRRISVRDFIKGPGRVDLGQGEIVTAVHIPNSSDYAVHHYEKVGRRKAQACAVVNMAAVLQVNKGGEILKARLAWGSVGPTVIMSQEVDSALVGKTLTLETLAGLQDMVEAAVSPINDVRASAEYRRKVAAGLLLRLSLYSP